MLLLPLGIGGFAILVMGVAKRAAARHSLPADVAASIRSVLKSLDYTKLNTLLSDVAKKYPAQAQLIRNAVNLEGDTHLTPDVQAAYRAALHEGQPEVMVKAAAALDAKYHYLAAHLRDVADVLATLKGVA